jgi:hypothetical protein
MISWTIILYCCLPVHVTCLSIHFLCSNANLELNDAVFGRKLQIKFSVFKLPVHLLHAWSIQLYWCVVAGLLNVESLCSIVCVYLPYGGRCVRERWSPFNAIIQMQH